MYHRDATPDAKPLRVFARFFFRTPSRPCVSTAISGAPIQYANKPAAIPMQNPGHDRLTASAFPLQPVQTGGAGVLPAKLSRYGAVARLFLKHRSLLTTGASDMPAGPQPSSVA